MGCCQSVEEKEDERLRRERKAELAEYERHLKDGTVKKLLFLGSGGSGKSTMFKQVRTIHGSGYADKDKLQFKDHIFAQIVEQMRLAFECIEILKEEEFDIEQIKLENENINKKHVGEGEGGARAGGEGGEGGEGGSGKAAIKKEIHEVMISYNDLELTDVGKSAADTIQSAATLQVTPEIADAIKILWKERAIKYIFALRSTMKLDDSCQYFWEEVDRISATEYVPNDYDILLVRYRTTGVIEQKFKINNILYHVFDVGGQKSERKKWVHCFEMVTAVLFCASLSCYNEVMFEDEEKNSMVDSIELFGQILNNEWFKETLMVLLLTKKDLFAEKIQRIPVTDCPALQQYAGVQDSNDDAIEYITKIYKETNKDRNKQIFTHVIDNTDKNDVDDTFDEVRREVVNATLARTGLT